WSHDHVMCGEYCEGVFENRTWQVWAVAVEGNNASFVIIGEVCKHRSEAGGKTLALLCHDARLVACHLRQIVYIRGWAHDGKVHLAQRPRQRQSGVEKTAIEGSHSLRRKAGSQASLDPAWPWCFRHDDQHAINARRTHLRLA